MARTFGFNYEKCKTCKGPMVPVIYGMPGPKMIKLAEDGLIKLGGCVPNSQKTACLNCDNSSEVEVIDLDFRCSTCDTVMQWDEVRCEWFCKSHPGTSEDETAWNKSLHHRKGAGIK